MKFVQIFITYLLHICLHHTFIIKAILNVKIYWTKKFCQGLCQKSIITDTETLKILVKVLLMKAYRRFLIDNGCLEKMVFIWDAHQYLTLKIMLKKLKEKVFGYNHLTCQRYWYIWKFRQNNFQWCFWLAKVHSKIVEFLAKTSSCWRGQRNSWIYK